MGYVAGFDEDVFISYAHNDDDVFAPEQWGWVTRLHQDLEQRVRNHLGSATAKFATTRISPKRPADFGKLIAEETEKWGKVIKFAGIKPQ
jgi:hypothetical protein